MAFILPISLYTLLHTHSLLLLLIYILPITLYTLPIPTASFSSSSSSPSLSTHYFTPTAFSFSSHSAYFFLPISLYTLSSLLSSMHLLSYPSSPLTPFVGNACRVIFVEFQENPLNWSPDKAVKVPYSLCKVPFFIGQSQEKWHHL